MERHFLSTVATRASPDMEPTNPNRILLPPSRNIGFLASTAASSGKGLCVDAMRGDHWHCRIRHLHGGDACRVAPCRDGTLGSAA